MTTSIATAPSGTRHGVVIDRASGLVRTAKGAFFGDVSGMEILGWTFEEIG